MWYHNSCYFWWVVIKTQRQFFNWRFLELVYSLTTDSQVSRSTVRLNIGCVGFLQMLYVILSHQYVNRNNNKMDLDTAKFVAREASFHKLLWLNWIKRPTVWERWHDKPRGPHVFCTRSSRAMFLKSTSNLLGKSVWCAFFLNHAQNFQF